MLEDALEIALITLGKQAPLGVKQTDKDSCEVFADAIGDVC